MAALRQTVRHLPRFSATLLLTIRYVMQALVHGSAAA